MTVIFDSNFARFVTYRRELWSYWFRPMLPLLPLFSNLGLPLSLDDFGRDVEDDLIVEGVTRACEKDPFVNNMPFPVTPQALLASIRRTAAVVDAHRKGKSRLIEEGS